VRGLSDGPASGQPAAGSHVGLATQDRRQAALLRLVVEGDCGEHVPVLGPPQSSACPAARLGRAARRACTPVEQRVVRVQVQVREFGHALAYSTRWSTRLRADVVHHAVDAPDLVHQPRGDGTQQIVRQPRPFGRHAVAALDRAHGDRVVVGPFIPHHADAADGEQYRKPLPEAIVPSVRPISSATIASARRRSASDRA